MKDFTSCTDEELALLYIDGDNRAFDELLARNQQKLYSYILFVVRDPELANDVFQDTFVKVITRLQEGRYTNYGKFSFWLTRIAHNVIMDCSSTSRLPASRRTSISWSPPKTMTLVTFVARTFSTSTARTNTSTCR